MLTTVHSELATVGADRPAPVEGEPARTVDVWLFVGVNGVGKTTTVGKVATRLTRAGTPVLLAALDYMDLRRDAWCPVNLVQVSVQPEGSRQPAFVN